MPFTYRNVLQRALTYAEVDGNLQTVEDLHDEAVTARDAAVLNAGIYASTTAGLAATTNGEYFSVPNSTEEGYLDLYKNNAGSAVLTKTYYSRPQGAMEEIGTYAALRSYTGSATVYYLRGRASLFDGANGVFRVDSTDTTSADNDGTIIVDGAGRRWKREFSGSANVLWFGAKGDGATDDTSAIQAAITYATANSKHIDASGGPFLITTISVTCPIYGDRCDSFGNFATFTSSVGAGVYAVRMVSGGGELHNVTVKNTGAGNGIDANLVSKRQAMSNVAVVTAYSLATGSGSIGVQYGTNVTPGEQAITCDFNNVHVRGYDICHYMRSYSNANTYRKLYALNTTVAAGTKSSHGFKIDGRGGQFDGLVCESNFAVGLETTSVSEENTISNFWNEGSAEQAIILDGQGNLLVNPYGFVGTGSPVAKSVTVGAYSRVIKNKAASTSVADFSGFSRNLIRNAAFDKDLGGLSWSNAAMSGGALWGFNSLTIANVAGGSYQSDHALTYLDLDQHSYLRGKTITYVAIGKAETGVTMSVRGIIRTSGGSNAQYATSESFPVGTPGLVRISVKIPTVAADAKYIVFRVNVSGAPTDGVGKGGEIAMPMIFVGKDFSAIEPQPATDGANTFYGSQTIYGGTWNGAHLVLGAYHLWVDATGDLRIKNGSPASDLDGAVVGAQT